jgi:hypothetical protein
MEINKELAEKIADNLEALFTHPGFFDTLKTNNGLILSTDRSKIAKEVLRGVQSNILPAIANDSVVEVYLVENEDRSGPEVLIEMVGKRTDTGDVLFDIIGRDPEDAYDKIRGKLW